MGTRVTLFVVGSVAVAGVVISYFNTADEATWSVRLTEVALACATLAVASRVRGDPWQSGPVEQTGAWVGPADPLNVGDRVLAPDAGSWWRAEVTQLHGGGVVGVHYLGWGSEYDRLFLQTQLQLEGAAQPRNAGQQAGARTGARAWLIVSFLFLALLGLFLSLAAHLFAVLGLPPALGVATWGLHVGIFVVVPAAILAGGRWGHPPGCWLSRMTAPLFAYAFINFFTFFVMASLVAHPGQSVPQSVGLRGFSGHWMVFYAAAASMLWSAIAPNDLPAAEQPGDPPNRP
jgi:hypothetical protein